MKFNVQNTSCQEHTKRGNEGFGRLHNKRTKSFSIPFNLQNRSEFILASRPPVIAPGLRLLRSGVLGLDSVNDTRIGQGTEVAQLITFFRRDLAQNTAHDLAGSGLGEVGNDYDFLWSCERPDDLPDLKDELLCKFRFIIAGEFTR